VQKIEKICVNAYIIQINTNTNTNINTSFYNNMTTQHTSSHVIDLKKHDIGRYGFLTEITVDEYPENLKSLHVILMNMHNVDNFKDYVDENVKTGKFNDINYEEIENYDLDMQKYIYSTVGIMISKYIWCNGEDNNCTSIPKAFGVPHYTASKNIGIVPILTHATVDLYNWKFINKNEPFTYEPTIEELKEQNCDINLGNLMVKHSMTNTTDEKWFYLVMIAIEHYGYDTMLGINLMNNFMNSNDNNESILDELTKMSSALKKMMRLVNKMYSNCNPEIFFFQNRIFLNGYKKTKFPDGLSIDETDIVIENFDGGSAAQSSLIQCIDSFLHAEPIGCAYSIKFLENMRNYMPSSHKLTIELLQNYAKNKNINSYVKETGSDDLINAYNDTVIDLKKFRSSHFGLVQEYIIKFTGEKSEGTGGTTARKFLNDLINATGKSIIKFTKLKNKNYELIIMTMECIAYILIMCAIFFMIFYAIMMTTSMTTESALIMTCSFYSSFMGTLWFVW